MERLKRQIGNDNLNTESNYNDNKPIQDSATATNYVDGDFLISTEAPMDPDTESDLLDYDNSGDYGNFDYRGIPLTRTWGNRRPLWPRWGLDPRQPHPPIRGGPHNRPTLPLPPLVPGPVPGFNPQAEPSRFQPNGMELLVLKISNTKYDTHRPYFIMLNCKCMHPDCFLNP